MNDRTNVPEWVYILISVLIGMIAFIVIYGVTPLNVQNDKWIMAGYDESDIIQHYSGWTAFRNSEWSFPLGAAQDMGVEDRTYISYTDSIPWVAIFFKCWRSVLPQTFQYFGLYALICYILQSIAAFMLIKYKTGSALFSFIASVLFTFAPIELERSLRHTSLGSQWLILFAILLYLYHKDEYKFSHYISYTILMVLAIGIHPYFLPAIGVFLLLCVIEDIKRKQIKSALYLVGILILTYGAGVVIGVLGSGVDTSRWGYGYYSMNLNAILNPSSLGGYTWSSFIKTYPQILGNYDGFNYIGVGIVFAVLVDLILIICSDIKVISRFVKKYIWELILLLCCTAFAVSNVITFNDSTLIKISLPEWLLKICGIFRASSRIFYPVYYCLFLLSIVVLWRKISQTSRKNAIIVVSFVVILQLFDIHTAIIEKHERMVANAEYISLLDDATVTSILAVGNDVLLDNFNDLDGESRRIAVAATKNNCKLYFSVAGAGNFEKTTAKASELLSYIKRTGDIGNHVVVTTDWDTIKDYMRFKNVGYYDCAGTYYIAKNDEGKLNTVAKGYKASDLTDANWTNGVRII